MIIRHAYLDRLSAATGRSPITALLGPRQCGKTTLARAFAEGEAAAIFDLESQSDRQPLQNLELVLGSLAGLVILDKNQLLPELFGVLRLRVDRSDNQARYLILGSASPALVKQASENRAGRVEFIELSGFDLSEVRADAWVQLWMRGGFPRAYLATSDEDSQAWWEGHIRMSGERDIPQLGITIPAHGCLEPWMCSSDARS